jgi:hypothetical protein
VRLPLERAGNGEVKFQRLVVSTCLQFKIREVTGDIMKALKWTLLLAAVIVVPILLTKRNKRVRPCDEENIRYDIDDYVADQGL